MEKINLKLPPMSQSEVIQLEKDVQKGAIIGLGSGFALAFLTKKGLMGYAGLGFLGGMIGLAIPILRKANEVAKKEEKKEAPKESKEPIPAPSVALGEEMLVKGEDDFRDSKK